VKETELNKSNSYSIYDNISSDIAIEISTLTKHLENVIALDNLSIVVKYGEIFGLLGPNGSGKTTTINIVSGLSKPTSGQVKVLGYDITENTHAVHATLGVVPQETALYEELTAWTNMTIHADLYGVRRSI
jgi:ABC-2 type transport system ATP-binding protein